MVRNNWIEHFGPQNATPTVEQLLEEGRYITEEPAIYVINVTGPVQALPQILAQLTIGAKPLATGVAPAFYMA